MLHTGTVHFKGESASQNVGTPATHAWQYQLEVTVVALSHYVAIKTVLLGYKCTSVHVH